MVSRPANQVSGSATNQPLYLETSGWDGTEFPNSSWQVDDGLWDILLHPWKNDKNKDTMEDPS